MKFLIAAVTAVAGLAFATSAEAQVVYSTPVVTYYAPATAYYAPAVPVTTYYAPATTYYPAVTYAPAVSYAPAAVYYVPPRVARRWYRAGYWW